MKIGFGLYRHMLDDDHFAFARQCGATHIVVHMVDYFRGNDRFSRSDQPVGDTSGWGFADGGIWTVEELTALRTAMAGHGLEFFAIENFDPLHWCDILFDGPRRDAQLETVKQIIRNVGAAGIKVIGYNFSLAGVAGRITASRARGGAQTVGLEGSNPLLERPLPNSMAWNMVVDPDATGLRKPTTTEQLWDRLAWFLERVVPVAEEAGVLLAAHPDDPPLDMVRGQPRLVNQPHLYQRLLDLKPSRSNKLEFCLGTIAEMSQGDVYEAVEQYSRQRSIAYMHFRNVSGRVPTYHEMFIDDGDIDMARVIAILKRNEFDGVLIPDHSPQMTCGAPWHAGMAFAMGYISAAVRLASDNHVSDELSARPANRHPSAEWVA